MWSETFQRELNGTGIFDVEPELTAAIATRLAQNYGVISTNTARKLRQGRPDTLFAYDCVQRALAYRRTFDPKLYPEVRTCLEKAVRRDPDYAAAWAMLAFAHLDAIPVGESMDPAARASALRKGLEIARHAVELAPDRVTSLETLATFLYWTGALDPAERMQRRAIALSPNNPQSLELLGWQLNARGRHAEAVELLQAAVDRSVSPPPWYYANLALARYLLGDLVAARESAQLARAPCHGQGYATLAITEAAVGNGEAARAALGEAIRQAPLLRTDPHAFWANCGIVEAVIGQLSAGLAKSGLPMTARAGEGPPLW